MHDDYIAHYGVKRRSGRYPWGSGDEPFQRGSESTVNGIARDLSKKDLKNVASSLGISNKTIDEAKTEYRPAIELISWGVKGDQNAPSYGKGGSPSDSGGQDVPDYGKDRPPSGSEGRDLVPSYGKGGSPSDSGGQDLDFWDYVSSIFKKIRTFLKRKISEIIDKFDD